MRDFRAERARGAEASRTMAASQKAQDLRRRGVDVISLTVGEPDFATPESVREAAKRALDEGFTKYTPSAGIPELREAIAEKSRRENGVPTDAAHTLVTPTKHALFASLMATVEPGDEVLLTDPCFTSYAAQVRLFGGRPVWVPLSPEHGYSIRAEDVAARLTTRSKVVMLCSPNNPTGCLDDPEEVKALVDLAHERDLLLISDEIYEKIVFEGRHVSPASLPGGAERTITINGLSKSFAMTGWRMGWLHAPDPVFDAIAKLQTQTITQVTSFVQKAALEALQGSQEPVRRMVGAFRRRRDLVVEEVENTPGLSLVKPTGAFYAWPRFEARLEADAFADALLERAHVAVVSGTAFGPSGRDHVRLSYATGEGGLREAFERIRRVLPTLGASKVAPARR